jgi:hypothetical protein
VPVHLFCSCFLFLSKNLIDNLLAPEKRATSPSSSDIINGFSLEDDNHYNEFQSDSNATNDNTVKVTKNCSVNAGDRLPFSST